jgi:hypothetical protein
MLSLPEVLKPPGGYELELFGKFVERSKVKGRNLPKALENIPEDDNFRDVYLFMR